MKSIHLKCLLGLAATVSGFAQHAQAQFTTLQTFGNATGTNPPEGFTAVAGRIEITAGGTDFFGNSDNGAFLWNDTGTQTTTGDFTASVRHIGTTNPAPTWGRDGIMARATQSTGTLSDTDAYWMATRRSEGVIFTNRRSTVGGATYRATDIDTPAVNYNSDDNERGLVTTTVINNPWFLATGRSESELFTGYAMDLGGPGQPGVAGRFIRQWSTSVAEVAEPFAAGTELIVGLAHQSHPQTITPDENDINTASFDTWLYTGTFDATKFGAASSANTWQLGGSVRADETSGQILGSAYVMEGGAATGEPVKWSVQAYPLSSFNPGFGTAGTRRDLTPMNESLTIPAESFRHEAAGGGTAPGLKADIYINATNAGNLAGNLALIANSAATNKASTIIPRVYWNTNSYPVNDMGENLFAIAHPDAFGTGLQNGQENYGVEMTGQIFIPGDADRIQPNLPGQFVLFKDGTDDFTYLVIDGQTLFNDSDWTDISSTANNGGNISVLDVSDPKYDDGEWVSFRMISFEGGGGDNVALFWDQNDTGIDPVFTVDSVPGTFGNLVPLLGVENSRKDPASASAEDLVPAGDFRHVVEVEGQPSTTAPGLIADIFNGGNPGTFEAIDAIVQNGGGTRAVIPNINWFNSAAGSANYPSDGAGGDVFGAAGVQIEAPPVVDPPLDPSILSSNGYANYGVNITGEIFIPGDALRRALPVTGGNNLVLFKDGVDDFTYLEIDGQVLLNDNIWTGPSSADNGGGHVSLMDVSDAKYDDGEWVPFRMITWEGGGGDSGVLYWSARDTNGSFGISSIPGTTSPAYELSGTNQIATESTEAAFGPQVLPAGDWLTVLRLQNTGTSLQKVASVSRAAAPGAALEVTSFNYNPATTVLNLAFSSTAGSTYALEYTIGFQAAGAPTNVQKWNTVPGYTSITGLNGTTPILPLNVGSTLLAPAGLLTDTAKAFFRIRKLP